MAKLLEHMYHESKNATHNMYVEWVPWLVDSFAITKGKQIHEYSLAGVVP